MVQVAADEVNQNIVVNKQPPANNKCISATSGVTSSCGGGVANTNRTVAANNNSSSTQNYNNNLVNSNISGSSFNRAGADKGPGDPIVGGNNNNSVNNFASSRSLDYNNFYETNNNESKYSFSNGHSIGGSGEEVSERSVLLQVGLWLKLCRQHTLWIHTCAICKCVIEWNSVSGCQSQNGASQINGGVIIIMRDLNRMSFVAPLQTSHPPDRFHAAIKGGTEVLLVDQTYRLDNR